ncbi:toxic anion resistance protein [Viridibacillus sp. NPDC093762]|uniref:toxic anion resistance protein n=1 Tax=Viridibacillus sp. NPDC093762 TaxID=3390720 RepID=UPI003D068E3F
MTDLVAIEKDGLNEQTANEMKLQLRQEPEVQKIVKMIDIKNQIDLLSLGKEPAIKLSRFSDRILDTMTVSKLDQSSELLNQLEKLMNKFDKNELTKEPGMLDKIFKRAKQKVDALFSKYNTLGKEIEKIHAQFMIIEEELKSNNRDLEGLYQEDIEYYFELEKYIVAAEMKLDEVKTSFIPECEARVSGGNQMARIELENLRTVQELLERKVDDLEKARMVAVIAAPQIKTMQRGNNDLIAKINSAFVTTIPVFKMGIINAVNARRQKLHADSLNAFEDRANQMLQDVTSDIMQQSVDIARRSGSSSIKMETIENMWDTIVTGIDEYKAVKQEQAVQRVEDKKRLETIREDAKRVLSNS